MSDQAVNIDSTVPFSAEPSKSGKSFLLVGLNERCAPGTKGYVSVWVNRLNRAYHMGVSAERRRLGSHQAQQLAQLQSKLTQAEARIAELEKAGVALIAGMEEVRDHIPDAASDHPEQELRGWASARIATAKQAFTEVLRRGK